MAGTSVDGACDESARSNLKRATSGVNDQFILARPEIENSPTITVSKTDPDNIFSSNQIGHMTVASCFPDALSRIQKSVVIRGWPPVKFARFDEPALVDPPAPLSPI